MYACMYVHILVSLEVIITSVDMIIFSFYGINVCLSDLLAYVPAWHRVLVHARFPNLHRHRTTEIKLPGKGMAEPHTTCTSWSPFPSPHIKRAEEKEALISIKATHLGTHIEMPVTHINDHLPFFLSLYLHILYKGRRVVAPGTLHLRYISVTQVTSRQNTQHGT